MWRKIIDDYRLQYLNDLFEIKLIFYGLSRMLQFSDFEWALSYSVWDFFNNFLLLDATDRSKISSDQKRFFIALSIYPFHFSRTLPLKLKMLSKTDGIYKKGKKAPWILYVYIAFVVCIYRYNYNVLPNLYIEHSVRYIERG